MPWDLPLWPHEGHVDCGIAVSFSGPLHGPMALCFSSATWPHSSIAPYKIITQRLDIDCKLYGQWLMFLVR